MEVCFMYYFSFFSTKPVLEATLDVQGQIYIALRQLLLRYAKGDDWVFRLLSLLPDFNVAESTDSTQSHRQQQQQQQQDTCQSSHASFSSAFQSDASMTRSFLFQGSPVAMASTTESSSTSSSLPSYPTSPMRSNTLSPQSATTQQQQHHHQTTTLLSSIPSSPMSQTPHNNNNTTLPTSPVTPHSPFSQQQQPHQSPVQVKPAEKERNGLIGIAEATDCLVLYTPSNKLPSGKNCLCFSVSYDLCVRVKSKY
jgi:hypothetical protein